MWVRRRLRQDGRHGLGCWLALTAFCDLDLLRYGGMSRLFGGNRAPSTLGTFQRRLTTAPCNNSTPSRFRLLAGLAGRAAWRRWRQRAGPHRPRRHDWVTRLFIPAVGADDRR